MINGEPASSIKTLCSSTRVTKSDGAPYRMFSEIVPVHNHGKACWDWFLEKVKWAEEGKLWLAVRGLIFHKKGEVLLSSGFHPLFLFPCPHCWCHRSPHWQFLSNCHAFFLHTTWFPGRLWREDPLSAGPTAASPPSAQPQQAPISLSCRWPFAMWVGLMSVVGELVLRLA